jgi:hypothetical protein
MLKSFKSYSVMGSEDMKKEKDKQDISNILSNDLTKWYAAIYRNKQLIKCPSRILLSR